MIMMNKIRKKVSIIYFTSKKCKINSDEMNKKTLTLLKFEKFFTINITKFYKIGFVLVVNFFIEF